MPHITRALLRKRAEHNEGMISTLEEISLHQEELESINEVLGMTCRKLKILYLQNNIIPKMENLYHMKDLTYLNLALNNISKIEGLHNCEFLRKLDLTVNFIDLDTLKESIENLQSRSNLQELYMMGNPSEANWVNFKFYVTAKLPQLQTLDGTEITKSMQIQARQKLPALEVCLSAVSLWLEVNLTAPIITHRLNWRSSPRTWPLRRPPRQPLHPPPSPQRRRPPQRRSQRGSRWRMWTRPRRRKQERK
jgi:protein TilB